MLTNLKSKYKITNLDIVRFISQFGFFSFILYISIGRLVYGGGKFGFPSLGTYSPFGGFVKIFQNLGAGTYIFSMPLTKLILLGATVLTAVVAGRAFCGWICPFGSVQEWLSLLGRRAFPEQIKLPEKIDSALRYIKYIILALILTVAATTGAMIFKLFNPYSALFHFLPAGRHGAGLWGNVTIGAAITMAIFLTLSMFIDRAWCRYACPFGAIQALFNKISFIKPVRNVDICKNCKQCSQIYCPMGIEISTLTETSTECIRCLRCVDKCNFNAVEAKLEG
ncbi:MAG TPA: 4Fe-4S binding protein [Actinobacteria bacterium]|nr:4Fe-4S binding protein [Actinomycetota bacterium]